MKKHSSTGDAVVVTDADLRIAAHKSENAIAADNPRLSRYQQLVQEHLEKLNDQLASQIRNLQISLKESRLSNQENGKLIEKLRTESQKEAGKTASLNDEVEASHKTRTTLDDEMAILNNSLEEAKTKMNSADKKEREVRNALNNINNQVGKVFGIEKAGGNLKTNVKILKGISARINQQLSSLEKEKTIQDAYVTRIKRDVEASEKELLNLENAFEELKKEQIQRKSNYEELAEKLKAFEDGSFSVEDRWQTLMKSLHNGNNKIKLDRSQTLEEKTKQFSLMAGNHTNEGELTRTANELSKIDAALAARLKIRRMKEQELEQFEKALNETKSDIVKRKEEIALLEEGVIRAELKTAEAKQQYTAMKKSKGSGTSDDDDDVELERVERKIEKLKSETTLNRNKARKLAELVYHRDQNVDELSAAITKTNRERSKSARTGESIIKKRTEMDQRKPDTLKKIADMKKDMAELTRRRIAATHKIERLEEEAKLLNENIIEEKKKLDGFNEVLRKAEIRKDGFDKETQALNEAVIDDEEERQEKELIAKLEREEENVTSIRGENEFIEKNLKASREELEMWMKKVERIDNDELYAFDEARRNAILIETRRLKNLNSVLNRRIRETQKELEMCALRRDFVVGKAQTTISRRNHVRSQAIDRIEQLKSRIAELRKELDDTNAEYVRLQTSSITK